MGTQWSVPFIGRQEEIKTIQTCLQAWGTSQIIFISGPGGIGKTRLLDEVEQQFAALELGNPLKILSIIDFDDDRYKFSQNVGISIARQLDPIVFDPYFEALRRLRILEEGRGGKDEYILALIKRQTFEIDQQFVECFHKVSEKYRIVLRLDTTETIAHTMAFSYLELLGTRLSNVLILAAGRNAHELYEKYKETQSEHISLIRLQPFTPSDSRMYLSQKQHILKVTLDRDWMDKLFILAGGLPILIDLAIEWAQNHRPLPWMDELSLLELQQLQKDEETINTAQQRLQALRETFKEVVVSPIADLDSKLDYLKFVLAKVYPLDREGVMTMLNLGQEEAIRVIDQAGQSVAIKILPDGRIKLHDEVQYLVEKYVWTVLDQDKQWELRDSRRIIAYLYNKSSVLLTEIRKLRQQELEQIEASNPINVLKIFGERREKESIFWSLRIERLRRQLAIDVQQGYDIFQYDHSLSLDEAPSRSYRVGLLDEMRLYAKLESPMTDIHNKILQDTQRLAIQQILAQEARYDGLYKEAAEICQQLLQRIPKNTQQYVETLIDQANNFVRAGKLREAMRNNEEALRLSKELGFQQWIIRSLLEIGWVHRLVGNLEQAIRHYNDAMRLALQNDDDERIALIYNNLAYAHALQHNKDAEREIQEAIRMWTQLTQEKEKNRFRLGQCYNIAGEVYLEMEHPEESLPYFELSWNIFDREEIERKDQQTSEWKSKSRSGRGFAYWHLAIAALEKKDNELAQHYLQNALTDLIWAADRTTDFDMPNILNRLGEVYFLLKNYDLTEHNWIKSMGCARQVGDAFNEFHSLSDLARLAFYAPVKLFPNWQTFENYYKYTYRRQYPSTHFDVLEGLFFTFLGHLALKQEEIEHAVALYMRGLPILAQHSTYKPFNVIGQLDFIEQGILPFIASESIRQVSSQLKEQWFVGSYNLLALNYFRKWSHWKEIEERSGGQHA